MGGRSFMMYLLVVILVVFESFNYGQFSACARVCESYALL